MGVIFITIKTPFGILFFTIFQASKKQIQGKSPLNSPRNDLSFQALFHHQMRCVLSKDWLVEKFNLDLSLVARLGGHSQPRTHRGKERFPGMTITYALIQMLEKARVIPVGNRLWQWWSKGPLLDVAKHRVCCGGKIASRRRPLVFP